MGVRSFQFVNLLLIGLLCMLSITGFSMAMGVENAKVRCIERERRALLNFKRGLQYSEKLLSSWGSKEEDCCRWKGIGCDNKTGHVILLDLRPVIEHKTATFITWLPMRDVWGGDSTNYVDNALVVWKGTEREYSKTLGLLKFIDLSSNKLTGEIPGEVTSLLGLIAVNLSRNYLIGIIPKNVGLLKLLESLDLSRNQLGGEIPMSLADISFLSYLDFSNNNLSGKIPSSTQLQGFNASRYMGNPRLCGPPLLSKCPGDETKTQDSPNTAENGESIKKDGEWFGASWSYASMGLGFALGLCGVCGTLLLNSSWRHAYFQFLNDMYDWFYVTTAVNIARLQRRH